jgi:hypothetical protein
VSFILRIVIFVDTLSTHLLFILEVNFNFTCLMCECVRTGIHVVQTVAAIFPYLNLERKFEARLLRVVRTGC